MRISKISSKATYHKCLKNLHSLGYIDYQPSYNPFKGSHVILFNFSDDLKPVPKNEKKTTPKNEPNFELVNEQVVNKLYTGNDTSNETTTEQALVSYINNTNIPNISNDLKSVNLDEHAKNFEIDDVIARNEAPETSSNGAKLISKNEKEKSSAKKEKTETLADDNWQISPSFADTNEKQTEKSRQKEETNNFVIPVYTERSRSTVEVSHSEKLKPTIENVKAYFLEHHFPELEAIKFFNYFSSNGWLVGGKTPMVDWQAAAQNWILNVPKFISNEQQPNRAKHLNAGTDKDYSEPL